MAKRLPAVPVRPVRFSPNYLEFVGSRTYMIRHDYTTPYEVGVNYMGHDLVFGLDPAGTGRVIKKAGSIYNGNELYGMLVAFTQMQTTAVREGFRKASQMRRATAEHEIQRELAGGLPAPLRKSTLVGKGRRVSVHPKQGRLL